jgi:uncharacterized protein (DUF849 family)
MLRIKAALNGNRNPLETTVPITPEQLASDAYDAHTAGAFAVHIHPRDTNGRESLEPDDVANAVAAIKGMIPVGVTTGLWITGDANKRHELVSQWHDAPDFASVNMDEEGAVELAELLISKGIGVEPGVSTPAAAETLMKSRVWKNAVRVLIEPQEPKAAAALATVDEISDIIADVDVPWLMHGVDATAWPLFKEAAKRRWETRIGFEDTLLLPDGTPAQNNAQLVSAARAFAGRR